MNDHNEITKDYKQWIVEIKQRIRQCQLNVSVKANTELLHLYWDMGADIFERQKYAKWGDGFLKQMSQDLSKEFPEMKGFSYSNLRYIRQWYQFYNSCFQNCQQAVGKLEGCDDNPTIGLLICKDKNDIVAEYSLRNIGTPIGVSSVQIYDQLTADYKSSLPTIEEIEEHLKET